ncbi:MAG TPA: hypothetical protein PK625_08555 [Spirochaetales bacterium]|nr:hypothetical protein [Spirochaetales bacterium]MBP7264063.1 hypothetical protein [Spirochaetia bacterium]HPE37188.1 hypothetical protein [Spirochaetales bacterium]
MQAESGIADRLRLAWEVMGRWEVLLTLAIFVAVWILFRNLADPWAREGRKRRSLSFRSKRVAHAPPEQAPADQDEADDEEDNFPL